MIDRWRGIFELLGLTMLAASLMVDKIIAP
jgi:hypothetical protein